MNLSEVTRSAVAPVIRENDGDIAYIGLACNRRGIFTSIPIVERDGKPSVRILDEYLGIDWEKEYPIISDGDTCTVMVELPEIPDRTITFVPAMPAFIWVKWDDAVEFYFGKRDEGASQVRFSKFLLSALPSILAKDVKRISRVFFGEAPKRAPLTNFFEILEKNPSLFHGRLIFHHEDGFFYFAREDVVFPVEDTEENREKLSRFAKSRSESRLFFTLTPGKEALLPKVANLTDYHMGHGCEEEMKEYLEQDYSTPQKRVLAMVKFEQDWYDRIRLILTNRDKRRLAFIMEYGTRQ